MLMSRTKDRMIVSGRWRRLSPEYTPAMRVLIAIAAMTGFLQAPAAQPIPAPAPPPGTDIYLVPLASGVASMKIARPSPVSIAPGYDNQPNFSPDGSRILFAANRDGKQSDVYAFDRGTGRVAQLTHTAENENSPTYVPAGAGPAGSFTVVQSEFDKTGARPVSPIQRLWRFNPAGQSPQLILSDINPVGYHAWMDADHLVLFVLGGQGKPATLQIASVKTGKAEIAGDNVGRSLHKIPGSSLASIVQKDPSGDYWVKELDITSKKITPLVKTVEGSSDRDMAWMPDGKTMLMSSGTKVFSWTRGASAWTEVFDGAASQLGAITRLSISPKGDAIAIVVAEAKK
jgi:Tol biopolymer transport system component